MAKKEEQLNYRAILQELRTDGAKNLYLLWGQEEYLREQFLGEIKKQCLPGGEDEFSYKRLNGPDIDLLELRNAVDSVPFMTDRTVVEVRGVDLNKIKDAKADTFAEIIGDIPDFCTLVFVQDAAFEPDGRLKLIKAFKKIGREIKFTAQSQGALVDWVVRRFAAGGKRIAPSDAQHLIFVSGGLMTRLIPEIEKVSAFASADTVTKSDIEAVAHHIPEARIFDMTDCIAARDNDGAARILAELLADRENVPIMLLATIGRQMRQLLIARVSIDNGLGKSYVEETAGIKFGFLVDKLMTSARKFTAEQLERAVSLCCEADYAMKSTGGDDTAILKDVVLRIAAEGKG